MNFKIFGIMCPQDRIDFMYFRSQDFINSFNKQNKKPFFDIQKLPLLYEELTPTEILTVIAGYIERNRMQNTKIEDLEIIVFAAFLGEMLIKKCGGYWAVEFGKTFPSVVFPKSLTIVNPIEQVLKNVKNGFNDSVVEFYRNVSFKFQLEEEINKYFSPLF